MTVVSRVGRRSLHARLDDARHGGTLDLSLRPRVVRVHRDGDTARGVEVEFAPTRGRTVRTISSRVLIDATEWGDVLPLTGVRHLAGKNVAALIRNLAEHAALAKSVACPTRPD